MIRVPSGGHPRAALAAVALIGPAVLATLVWCMHLGHQRALDRLRDPGPATSTSSRVTSPIRPSTSAAWLMQYSTMPRTRPSNAAAVRSGLVGRRMPSAAPCPSERAITALYAFCREVDDVVDEVSDADVARSGFEGARLRGAKLRGVRGDESVWLRADLASADLRYASLRRATFSEADASRALFFGADLRHAHLDRARLDFADFERANLFGADMRRASLVKTSFRGASLYGAVLLGAATSTADFTGASLGAATRDPT